MLVVIVVGFVGEDVWFGRGGKAYSRLGNSTCTSCRERCGWCGVMWWGCRGRVYNSSVM